MIIAFQTSTNFSNKLYLYMAMYSLSALGPCIIFFGCTMCCSLCSLSSLTTGESTLSSRWKVSRKSSHFSHVVSSRAKPCHWTKTSRADGEMVESHFPSMMLRGSIKGWSWYKLGGFGWKVQVISNCTYFSHNLKWPIKPLGQLVVLGKRNKDVHKVEVWHKPNHQCQSKHHGRCYQQ